MCQLKQEKRMMKSDCCGAEPSNLSEMKCAECLENTCFTEEFADGDVIRHIPAEDFSEWLEKVDTVDIKIEKL